MPISNMVHLYVNVSIEGLNRNLNSEPFSQLEDRTQVIVPDFELVALSVYDDEEMVANNEYMDFRTETDDEFEEFDFDGREHELPSNTLTQIDMDVIDSIREHDPIVAPVVADNSELYKGMICQDKETLQHMSESCTIGFFNDGPRVLWCCKRKIINQHRTTTSHMKKKFGYRVPYHRAWDGKRKVVAKVFGDWDESYKLLPKWLYMVKHTNPGTCVEWRVRDTNIEGHVVLTSVFWAFGPCIEVFNRCRPIIQIDGTHLYGKYRGKLLIATFVDSNRHLLPLAFAIVDEESVDSWGWFLQHLKKVVFHDEICLVSDRHADIISTVNNPTNGWT
ncbi:uncharacterized protein E6C27_scaffold548G001300 [Cucumis melo var. makuwa]|uniref:MULE transposase domain-containing protein n=1 Tax=Cucumis melo var. makuwa TaxID=1194695 RepID=A0A5A7VEM9_CUCMM|nr:uncharacterized protein E6C27_scaffold548G001300 [Cucumis melo var. makuwa]